MKVKKCLTKYCRNMTKHGRYCNTCRCRKFRKKHPVKYAYLNLKANAKRRQKEFDLTFEQFKAFCLKTKYHIGKGRTAESYTIDRIDNTKGYTIDNIQVLTNADNVRKYLVYDYQTKEAYFVPGKTTQNSDNPF